MRGLFVSIRVTTRSIDSTHPNQVAAVRIQRQGTVPYGFTKVSKGPAASAGNTLTDPMAPLAEDSNLQTDRCDSLISPPK